TLATTPLPSKIKIIVPKNSPSKMLISIIVVFN
ncbi:MAG: hypothetical protein ACI9RM_001604, partial [Ulvibacter sp.]